MRNKKWVQVVILSVLFVIGGYTIATGLFEEKDKIPKVGDQAPNFTLTDLEGDVIRLSDYKGKAIMLNFWGTFCPPCVYEMPLFQEYYEQYKDQDFVVLGVNLDEATVTVKRFVKEYGLTFPIPLDKNVVRKQYGVTQYPTTFFINKDGVIIQKIDTLIEERHLKPIIDNLLK
jgi:peroxiredoxin